MIASIPWVAGYEWDVGHFKGAQRPQVDNFKETDFGLSECKVHLLLISVLAPNRAFRQGHMDNANKILTLHTVNLRRARLVTLL